MDAVFKAKVALARAVGGLSRSSGRGGGTTLPGRMLVRMDPEAITRLAAGLEGGAIVVSSTNGKTTTAAMIASILRAAGREPVHNRAGEVVGSAFAVGPDLVATCAHVVATATGADPYAAVAPGETRGRLPDAVR